MIPESDILLRVMFAALLGFVIGIERERQDHSAGLRTHMILVIGAALAMPISINVAVQFSHLTTGGDPARLAAQVVSGIGFLGAGVIFRYGSNVRGLTTAASLWTMAVIGLAVGAGLYWSGAIITLILFLILTALNYLEEHVITTYNRLHLTIWASDRPGLMGEIKQLFDQKKRRMKLMDYEKDLSEQQVTMNFHVRLRGEEDHESVVAALTSLEGVKRVKLSE